jgi:hypothetical protein
MPGPGGDEAAARPGGRSTRLGSSPAELDRLRRQSAELAGHSVMLRNRAGPPGHSRRTIRVDLVRSMRPRILGWQRADERELEEQDRAAREHLGDPGTLVLPHLFFLAWGRKPLT